MVSLLTEYQGLLDLDFAHLNDAQTQQVRNQIDTVSKALDEQCLALGRLRYVIAGEHSNGKSWFDFPNFMIRN